MKKFEQSILSLVMSSAVAALLMMSASVTAQTAGEPQEQPPAQEQQQSQDQKHSQRQEQSQAKPTAPARRAVPQVTGTVTRWTGNRIDLKTPDGNLQKVAVNRATERLVEIKEGAEVTVEYRRKVSGFVIATKVLPAEADAPAAQPGTSRAPGQKASALTGSVVSWNNAALLLRTDAGDVDFFLAPSTEYLVKSLDPGLLVTVEYKEGTNRAKMATRVLAAKTKGGDSAKSESGSE